MNRGCPSRLEAVKFGSAPRIVFFESIDRQSGVKARRRGYPGKRRVFACLWSEAAHARLSNARGVSFAHTSLRASAMIRRSVYGYSSDGSGDGTITVDRQSGLESRWNFFFLPFSRFPPAAAAAAAASSPRVRSRNATWFVNNNFEWKKKVFARLKGTVEQALHLDRLDLIETNQWEEVLIR